MASDPRAFLAIDLGGATSSVALIGRIAHRWRLVGSLSMPSATPVDAIACELIRRVAVSDPELAIGINLTERGRAVDADALVADLPRLVGRSAPRRTLLALAVSARALGPIADAARKTGWRTSTAQLDGTDALKLTNRILDPAVDVLLVGAGDPPGADERRQLSELAGIVAGAVARRPDLTVVLAGAMADHLGRLEASGEERPANRPGELLLAPAANAGDPPGAPLRELLDEVRGGADDPRRAAGRITAALADVLDRRVELIEIGMDGGLRATASPGVGGDEAVATVSIVADAALLPPDPDDATVDRVLGWMTTPIDRHRLRDRLRELRLWPWSGIAGDGARLRLAAARAAMGILVDATPEQSALPAPDLIVVSGGAFAVAPGPAIALAVADVLRRPGAVAIVHDHARVLGALGVIPDASERRQALIDLADDVLTPLGSVVIPAGIRAGGSAGRLTVHAETGASETELVPGALEVVDLPPGEVATAELSFRDTVRLGARGRKFAVDVSGGLGGLLVDLRDVPLRLPDRIDRRRELLDAWQESLWLTRDR
ncbi:MAG TPA: hypothetical protein VFJ71_13855 [Candidatus Limnocylindrales bacterium]|nr:hypothetical protein [Candidatus Limnocylindrales bacterium]